MNNSTFMGRTPFRVRGLTCRSVSIAAALALCAMALAQDTDYHGKNLTGRNMDGKTLDGANFEDAVLTKVHFVGASLKGANFKDADISDVWFTKADLSGADFDGAICGRFTSFAEANLTKAKMAGLEFKGGQFYDCKMQEADLRNTKGLRDLRNADLRNADLRGANLVNMGDPAGYSGVKLTGAKYDSKTRWPEGFDLEGSGARLVERGADDK
jgi:uncharacterized protein YjbI with pentapeptide repeats